MSKKERKATRKAPSKVARKWYEQKESAASLLVSCANVVNQSIQVHGFLKDQQLISHLDIEQINDLTIIAEAYMKDIVEYKAKVMALDTAFLAVVEVDHTKRTVDDFVGIHGDIIQLSETYNSETLPNLEKLMGYVEIAVQNAETLEAEKSAEADLDKIRGTDKEPNVSDEQLEEAETEND